MVYYTHMEIEMEVHSEIEVLIAGAGAAGLTLAIDLARRGRRFRIIDKLERPFPGSRGTAIQPRSQEVFEDLGIVDRMVAAGGFFVPQREYNADGSYVVDPGETRERTPGVPYGISLMVPQFRTEGVMRERLAELGGRVEFGYTLASFEQDDEGVTAHLSSAAGVEAVRARYLVGADGGRSFVRSTLGLGFSGKTLGVRAIVADVALTGIGREAWHLFNGGDMSRLFSICPLAGTDLFQFQGPVPLEGEVDLSTEGLERLAVQRTGRTDLHVQSVSWASAYSMNARLADQYRIGKIFLIGDAAHIHPPTGGQGLNTSVQDAYNIGWKLAAVLDGTPDALLDSYEEERRPVAQSVLGLSTSLLEARKLSTVTERGRDAHQLDIGYPGLSLALDAASRADAIMAGDRMPDAALLGRAGQPRRLFDLLAGPQWTLLHNDPASQLAVTPRKGLRVIRVGADGELLDPHDQLLLREGDYVLVRPDGYIGAVFDASSAAPVEDYLKTVLPVLAR
jgi:2-polyprenyl-6-methoxyphenol hydroxylase-like FAD-dependent oxidoreductase